ncbi:phragmoplastin interacting protein 1 [Lathyrus oleraceus]|uniref:Uncharacterized protein n=1 Tax=Pisum sativum TaxID=3888 RepID=A0A9D5ABH1_PEA|nr:phragmoplastin interacting protein 1-like [Pisum sativum]KAI5401871.1 hypothetical protein KIW84_066362 [Pisum sativum]
MVLSNKKLKQKLRAELTLNQINTESNPSSSSSNSFKLLLNSSTNKPILSKREKLRKVRPLQQTQTNEDEGTKNDKEIGIEGLGKKNSKKRKIKAVKQNDDADDVGNEVVVKKGKIKVEKQTDDVGDEVVVKKGKVKVEKQNGDVGDEVVVKVTKQSVKKEKQKKKNLLKKKRKKAKAAEENGKVKTAEENGVVTAAEGSGSNHQEEISELTTDLANTNITTRQESGDAATKVYVGGIPYYSSEDDIHSYFESCGTITEINCMTFPDTGKFRGIAIIVFKTEAAAKRALALDGSDMGGLFLKIQPYKAAQTTRFTPELKEGYNRIYVGSLSWEITEEELRKFFSNCNIKSIRLGKDKETGEFRGYAHVDFSDSKSLKTALALDQSVLFGRPVRISCAVPLNKKPGAGEKSVAGSKPSAVEKSVAGSKPSAGEKSVAGSKPSAGEKSFASSKPGAVEKSFAGSKPSAGEKSVAGQKPDAGETVAVEEPTVEKPITVVASGKRKNRMCYGCRQKGHNLSECPNPQIFTSTI